VTVLVIANLLSMLACYLISRSRSADLPLWIIVGLFFDTFAIPFACLAKLKTD